ncbi:MAG TPA: PaaX family transcriptional regulator C-terminal domain-containing protein [Micromonospora sp.]
MSPFNDQEILPDLAHGTLRIPRRPAVESPRALAVTLLADYTLRHRAWLPSAAIVALLVESGLTAASARTAISRLARRGVLERTRHGRQSLYRLTQPAAATLAAGGRSVVAFALEAESWDGHWTLIAFSVPQERESVRRVLRSRLRWMGFMPLYDGLWVSPNPPPTEITALGGNGIGAVTVFRARHVDVAGCVARDPRQAWDMAAIDAHYAAFLTRWGPLVPRVATGDITGAEALRARTEVMEIYRRFKLLDPALPMRLMPPGWLRHQARETFMALYDGLADPAVQYVRRTVARVAEGFQPGIRAHTVAEMVDGLVPGEEAPGG